MKIHIIHENPQWFLPLKQFFIQENFPFSEMNLTRGSVNLSEAPPAGVFFSKMSASSAMRGNVHAPDYCFVVFAWLEAHGRRIINGSNVLRLELSKMEQYLRLQQAGLPVPSTVACFSNEDILIQAKSLQPPYILKPNRGGKGAGVQLFYTYDALEAHVRSADFSPSVDNITLMQQYIRAASDYITRLEFIGGKFVYAVRVDTSQGFELCPAEACRLDTPRNAAASCSLEADANLFTILKNFSHPLVSKLESFLEKQGIEVAGVEFIEDAEGRSYVYDINTNTNYNPEAERTAGVSALPVLAKFLTETLEKN